MINQIDKRNEGRKVELVHTSDPYTRLRKGDKGTYEFCLRQPDGRDQHCTKWDSGSNLMLIQGVDSFKFAIGGISCTSDETKVSYLCDLCLEGNVAEFRYRVGDKSYNICKKCSEGVNDLGLEFWSI